jgi:hypothetical protein
VKENDSQKIAKAAKNRNPVDRRESALEIIETCDDLG